jgi:probable O-glycosylation ligase (exosortase A-associated)
MRDLLIVGIVLAGSLAAFRRPWIGVMLWVWLSIMNPHRYAWGIAYDAPLAAMAAASTLLGLLLTRERTSPFKGAAPVWLFIFVLWITLSWLLGLDPKADYPQWDKVMKIYLMIFVGLALLHTKQHIFALAWATAGSLAILGAKGGFFTVLTGGSYRVWGPPGSFIQDNNEFALSLVMTIPLLRFLQMQLQSKWGRHVMTLTMLLCAAAAVGTYSRGALLAITAMGVLLWWRGKSRLLGGVVILSATLVLLAFMPEAWSERMSSIGNYEEDRSAMGRISAWWNAWGIAKDYVTGVGFNAARPELFARYSPYPDYVHAAHSIYFQVMGNHGFMGLFIFTMIFVSTYWAARQLRVAARLHPQAQWCEALGAMCQVSLVGYAVGGALLSLSYFDLPYNIMMLVLLSRAWVARQGWLTEPTYTSGWRTIPGLAKPPPSQGAPAPPTDAAIQSAQRPDASIQALRR